MYKFCCISFIFIFLLLSMTSCVSKKKYLTALEKLDDFKSEKDFLSTKVANDSTKYFSNLENKEREKANLEKELKALGRNIKNMEKEKAKQLKKLRACSNEKEEYLKKTMEITKELEGYKQAVSFIETTQDTVAKEDSYQFVLKLEPIFYGADSIDIAKNYDTYLQVVAAILKQRKELKLYVTGYASGSGNDDKHNQTVSEKRVKKIRITLEDKFHINENRLIIEAKGNYFDSFNKKYRRVDLVIKGEKITISTNQKERLSVSEN